MTFRPSVDNLISQNQQYGNWTRAYAASTLAGTKTAATVNSGYTTMARFLEALTLPAAFGAGVTGVIPTQIAVNWASSAPVIVGLEYLLGTLTLSGNSFAAGVAMPSRRLVGDDTAFQTASLLTMLVIDTTLVATTPVITITYTDQDGNPGNTATLTLPTNSVKSSAFLVGPHLAAGDTGVRAITNMSTSAGTGGVIKAYGVIPQFLEASITNVPANVPVLQQELPICVWQPGDSLGFYAGTNSQSLGISAIVTGVAES